MPSLPAAGEALTAWQRRRSLAAVIASAGAAGLTFGLTIPLLALILEADGVDSTRIGLNAASSAIAVLAVGPFVPRVLDALGVLRAMYLSILASVVIILLMPLWTGLWSWFLLRFLLGAFGAIHWIVGETWIISVSTPTTRGRVIALYMTVLTAGFAAGPVLINLVGIEGWLPFLLSAGLIGLAGVPLLLAYGCAPRLPPRVPAAVALAFRTAPLVLAAAALAGFTDTAVFSLLPVYGLDIGLPQDRAVLLLTVMLTGNVALQVPIGWLADRTDRRCLLIACGAVFMVCPLLLPQVLQLELLLWPLLAIWGGASLGIYTLALTIVGDRFEPAALAGANAAVVAVYEAGSVLGPVSGGVSMDSVGPDGLMWLMAAAAVLFLAFAAYRSVTARPN